MREWWIGITEHGWEKWLTRKHPNDTECRHAFISNDGSDKCIEYVAAIERNAYEDVVKERDDLYNRWMHWNDKALEYLKAQDTYKAALEEIVNMDSFEYDKGGAYRVAEQSLDRKINNE